MEDDIDYGALFGVTPEGEDTEPRQEEQDPRPAADTGEDSPLSGTEPENPQPEGTLEPASVPAQEAKGEGQDPALVASNGGPHPSLGGTTPTADAREGRALPPDEAVKMAIDEAFALSGLKNPYTGQPITSKAEYDAYRERFERDRREQVLKQTGMTQEEFQRFVQELPEMREARQARESAERAVREAREAAARVKLDEQIREIGKLDPSIKSPEDLLKMPTYQKFYELVRLGNSFTDAFRLANFDALAQRSAAGARQAAVNSARSKEHLTETKTRGSGAASVPAEVREQYKLFNPDATEEEIQKHWQRSHKA